LINIYFIKYNPTISKLKKKIKELEIKLENIYNEGIPKKINIAIVNQHLYINGIGRFISVLSDLLVKTGKYNVFLMTEVATDYDFKYNKKIKRIVQKMDSQALIDFDEANDIDIYIYNNEFSTAVDLYHSLGKKVIVIFHGVFLSCVFSNHTENYHIYKDYSKFDSFVHIIPDDYYFYKKFGFSHSIFIPNIYTFDYTNTPSSKLLFKNILMVGRVEDVIKGAKFGILAMAEILKEVPDAKLTIVGLNAPENLKNLTKELNIEKNVYWPGFSTNISEFYLNSSVLLVTSVTESFPMVMNEGKAHGLPIVAFNIDYSPCFNSGVILVEMFDYISMAKETIKLLQSYDYRKKKGKEAKLSLKNYINNNETIDMWDKLFNSLMGYTDFKEFQKEVEKKYYNETLAKTRLEKHYYYGQQFNEYFRCYS
jgi:glycosyltransferase involved in cell wall biosynthesis